jgi:hydroxypyruvate reductase
MNTVLQLTPLPVPPDYRPPTDLPIERIFESPSAPEWLAEHGSSVRAVVTHSLRGMPAELWAKLPRLQLIANFGAGLDLIDLQRATTQGVQVTYTPDLLTHDVADLAMALLLAASRRLIEANEYLRGGAWGTRPFPPGRSTKGRNLGILGFGRIGQAIARRAQAFDMHVGYHSRSRCEAAYTYYSTPLELAQWADILIAAVPGGDDTYQMVDERLLHALGSGGIFVNIARGSVVDERALVAALRTGVIAAAGLDVFDRQPVDGSAYAGLSNVVLTPHIGSSTTDTRTAMADSVYANVHALLSGGRLHDLARAT